MGVTDTVATIALGTIDADFPVTTTIDMPSKVVDVSLMAALGTLAPILAALPALHQLRDAEISLVGTSPKAASTKSRDDSAILLGMGQYHFTITIHVSNRPCFYVGITC